MGEKTIEDFGKQWTRYTDNEGYYGSVDQLADIAGPLLDVVKIKGKRVAEIGSGTGRIVNMLLDLGAEHVIALEPSDAMGVCRRNTMARNDRIEYVHDVAEALPRRGDLDYVFSIGVLHHIEDPDPGVRAAYEALKPGGEFLVWLYGKEGNEFYLRVTGPLRWITTRLGDSLLAGLTWVLDALLDPYILLCRVFPLPLRRYLLEEYTRLTRTQRRLVIFDQLNPQYAKYYTKDEARDLLARGGFEDIELYHRYGYSWTVKGRKPT